MIYLTGIYFFVLLAVNFADISSTCNSPPIFNLTVIFLIPLLPSNSAKIWVSNYLLTSDTIFFLQRKISITLCWPTSRETKSFLTSLTRDIKRCIIRKLFPQEFVPTKVWSKISHGDESTSSQTSNYFLCIFSGKLFFL